MRALAAVCVLLAAVDAGAQQTFAIPPDLWDRPRSARLVMDQPGVRQALDQYLAQPAARLVIHHGRGQEPLIQAEELRMWLMALAVDGERISLAGDAKPPATLGIEVSK